MGIWKKQRPTNPPATPQSVRQASRQRADDVRGNAQRYTDITEHAGVENNDRRTANRQRKQAEKDMAALRAEAVQARRLATHIENLHQPARKPPKGRIMTTTIADPGQAQRMRRTTDSPQPAGGQLNFNPLHPSMELPPEQLIRLLGLENKTKRRKKRPGPGTVGTGANEPFNASARNNAVKQSPPIVPLAKIERGREVVAQPFGESYRHLLIPSLVAGTIAGIAISAYLFWSTPDEMFVSTRQTTPAPTTRKMRPIPEAIKAVPTVVPPVNTNRQGTVKRAEVIPQIKINVEEKRLHSDAEQRFSARMTEQETGRELRAPNEGAVPQMETPITMPTTPANERLDTAAFPEPMHPDFQTATADSGVTPPAIKTGPGPASAGPDVVQDSTQERAAGEALF